MKGEAIPALGKQEPLIPVLFHSCIGVDAYMKYNEIQEEMHGTSSATL